MAWPILFSGCAARDLAVKNADTLIEYQVNKRLHLSASQKDKLSIDVRSLLNDKQYGTQIEAELSKLDINNPESIDASYGKLTTLYDQISLAFASIISKYIQKLSPEQQGKFFDQVEDENKDIAKKDPDDLLDKAQERFKSFFGSIDETQQVKLRELAGQLENNNTSRLLRRRKLHAAIKNYYSNQDGNILESFRIYQEEGRRHQENLELIKSILPTLSKDQKIYFKQRQDEILGMIKLYLKTKY